MKAITAVRYQAIGVAKDIGQDNKKPFENGRVLYKSSRGPEGGTIPRW